MERAELITNAKQVLEGHLRPINALVAEIKSRMQHGTDTISNTELHDWALALPIMVMELSPVSDAYNLTKNLLDIEIGDGQASTMLTGVEGITKKKDLEAYVKTQGTGSKQKKAVNDYFKNALGGVIEAANALTSSIKTIINARRFYGEEK